MDIINGLHGLGIALAIAVLATLAALLVAADNGKTPRHAAKIVVGALIAAVVAGFLIGATA